jgi:O-methyltransferase
MTFLKLLARSPQLARVVPRYAKEIGSEAKVLASAGLPRRSAFALAARHWLTHRFVPSPHYVSELTLVSAAVIERRDQPGDVIELGAYKGSSTAKLSSACRLAGKRLWVFDSFEGLPEPAVDDVEHQIDRPRRFAGGDYAGSLEEVRSAVRRFGSLEVCTFVPGWFSETLADFDERLSVAFVDVDLTESTRQAVAATWPSLVEGGVLFVHDATDAKLRALLADTDWRRELSAEPRTSFLPSRTDGFQERRSRTLAWFLK